MEENNKRIGEWVKAYEKEDPPTKCNLCGFSYMDYVWGYEYEPEGTLPKFCPECGAEMSNGKSLRSNN